MLPLRFPHPSVLLGRVVLSHDPNSSSGYVRLFFRFGLVLPHIRVVPRAIAITEKVRMTVGNIEQLEANLVLTTFEDTLPNLEEVLFTDRRVLQQAVGHFLVGE